MWLWLWLWLCVNPRATKFGDLIFPLQPHASCTSLTRLFPLTRLLHASYSSACRETKLANPTLPLYLMILSDNNIVLHSTKLDCYHFFPSPCACMSMANPPTKRVQNFKTDECHLPAVLGGHPRHVPCWESWDAVLLSEGRVISHPPAFSSLHSITRCSSHPAYDRPSVRGTISDLRLKILTGNVTDSDGV